VSRFEPCTVEVGTIADGDEVTTAALLRFVRDGAWETASVAGSSV